MESRLFLFELLTDHEPGRAQQTRQRLECGDLSPLWHGDEAGIESGAGTAPQSKRFASAAAEEVIRPGQTIGSRVVLVTGAGGGLGKALVRAFRTAGWRVAAAGHREAPAGEGDDLLGCAMDVTDGSQCERAVAYILERWGRLDVLINNAGITSDRLVMEMTDADWDRVIDVHLKGAFLCSRAALPAMVRQGDGQILNISSFAARSGVKGQVNYAAAKAGLIGLTLSLAREVAEHGVRVNAVLPGLLPTKLTAELSETARKVLVANNLLNRMNGLEEVATLVVGLASTRDVSGQVLQWDSRIGRWT